MNPGLPTISQAVAHQLTELPKRSNLPDKKKSQCPWSLIVCKKNGFRIRSKTILKIQCPVKLARIQSKIRAHYGRWRYDEVCQTMLGHDSLTPTEIYEETSLIDEFFWVSIFITQSDLDLRSSLGITVSECQKQKTAWYTSAAEVQISLFRSRSLQISDHTVYLCWF